MPWYLWRPCLGIPSVLPPLATWAQMIDGTLTLKDVSQMHLIMDEAQKQVDAAKVYG